MPAHSDSGTFERVVNLAKGTLPIVIVAALLAFAYGTGRLVEAREAASDTNLERIVVIEGTQRAQDNRLRALEQQIAVTNVQLDTVNDRVGEILTLVREMSP